MAEVSLKKNIIWNVIRTISTVLFPLISFPYLSRIIGPEGIGKINFATSFVSYFIMLSSIGVPLYGIREIARVRKNKENLISTTQELFILHFAVSIVVYIGFIGIIYLNGKLYDEKLLFFITSFSIILTALGVDWLYQGLEKYEYITIRSLVFSFLSLCAIFIFIHNKEDYILSSAITVFATLGSSILNFYKARKIIFVQRTRKWDFKRHLKSLTTIYIMNFIISIYIQLDTVMLGFLSSPVNVGYYSSAIKITRVLLMIVSSIGTVLLPRLSFYIANEMKAEFDELITKSIMVVFFLSLPTVISEILLSNEIIIFFAGIKFLPAASCMAISAPIIFFIGLTNIFGIQILFPLGFEKKVVISALIGAIISLTLNFILIPRFAHVGAAIATLMTELTVFLIQMLILKNKFSIQWPTENIKKYCIASIVLFIFLILIKIIVPQSYRLIVSIPLGIIIYFGVLILMKESFMNEAIAKLKNKDMIILQSEKNEQH
jgi:O-antigen/teichoic acid export membrane protein